MVTRGSAPDAAPHWSLALPAVIVGLLAMAMTAALTAPLGIRPMLIASELALASPALLMSGSPEEGALLDGLKPEPLPPGRGVLLGRRSRRHRVQVALHEPDGT